MNCYTHRSMSKIIFLLIAYLFVSIKGQSYDDARCKCICTVVNGTHIYKQLHITSVPPNNDCDSVELEPTEEREFNNQTKELCPRCQCVYESRNTTIIKFVVIIVVWVVSLLLVYMIFLICLDPILNNRLRNINYMEHTNEEDESPNHRNRPHQLNISTSINSSDPPDNISGNNVLYRVSHQQDKWKKQVREQRKNIYDNHTMLN